MKCRKFYQYVAKFVLDVAITNSFILYKNAHPTTKVNVLTFRHVLSEELIGDYCSKRRPGRSSNLIRTMPLQHHPFRVQNPNGGFKRGRCALHMDSRKRKDTQWFCHDCGVWLCHPGTEDDDCYFQVAQEKALAINSQTPPSSSESSSASQSSYVHNRHIRCPPRPQQPHLWHRLPQSPPPLPQLHCHNEEPMVNFFIIFHFHVLLLCYMCTSFTTCHFHYMLFGKKTKQKKTTPPSLSHQKPAFLKATTIQKISPPIYFGVKNSVLKTNKKTQCSFTIKVSEYQANV